MMDDDLYPTTVYTTHVKSLSHPTRSVGRSVGRRSVGRRSVGGRQPALGVRYVVHEGPGNMEIGAVAVVVAVVVVVVAVVVILVAIVAKMVVI